MVSFYNLIGSNLVLQTEQREVGKVRLQFLPDWRTAVTGMTRKVDQPQFNDPNLSVKESSGRWDLEYLGGAGLTSGVTASYLSGSYSGTSGAFAPSYTQPLGRTHGHGRHFRALDAARRTRVHQAFLGRWQRQYLRSDRRCGLSDRP